MNWRVIFRANSLEHMDWRVIFTANSLEHLNWRVILITDFPNDVSVKRYPDLDTVTVSKYQLNWSLNPFKFTLIELSTLYASLS